MSDFEFTPTSPAAKPARNKAPAKEKSPEGFQPRPSTLTQSEALPETADPEGTEEKSKEPLYSQEELLKIFDEIIFSGEYTEDNSIRGRLQVTFRTRTAEDHSAVQRAIDSSGFNLVSSVEDLRSLMNLQYAIVKYQQRDLSLLSEEERLKFVKRLPGPVVGALLIALNKFDYKVALACQEGQENF